jgi:hypothetical protein
MEKKSHSKKEKKKTYPYYPYEAKTQAAPQKEIKLKKGKNQNKTMPKKKDFLENSYRCRSSPTVVGPVVA